MACSAIICDWNGTLYQDVDEEFILREIARDVAKSYIPWHPMKLARLLNTNRELEALNNERNRDTGNDRISAIFRIYSEKVIEGVPASVIHRSVKKYSSSRQVQNRIIHTAMRPVAGLHLSGITTGILSAGYGYGIRMILTHSIYGDCFDFYEANQLVERDGIAIEFVINILKNKQELLVKILRENGLDCKNTVYMGDSLDDAGCFEIVGHPVVSFLTPERLKEQFAQKYRAFVPADENELLKYLHSI